MQIKVESTHLNGVVVLAPEVFQDSRGFFMETYRDDQFREMGLPTKFVQDNHSAVGERHGARAYIFSGNRRWGS